MSTISSRRTATHEVVNQPPPLADYDPLAADPALHEALVREGGEWGLDRVRDFGNVVASGEALAHAKRAQRNIPVLRTHDRYGHRVDEIDYDPSMHWMLRLGVEREVNSLPWRDPRPGAHVVRTGMFHLFNQLDTGPCCPMSINYAAVPTMRQDATLAAAVGAKADAARLRLLRAGRDGDDREAGRLGPARELDRRRSRSATAGSS